jgi:hypothetical protein
MCQNVLGQNPATVGSFGFSVFALQRLDFYKIIREK